jgi:hypothetical protein
MQQCILGTEEESSIGWQERARSEKKDAPFVSVTSQQPYEVDTSIQNVRSFASERLCPITGYGIS